MSTALNVDVVHTNRRPVVEMLENKTK